MKKTIFSISVFMMIFALSGSRLLAQDYRIIVNKSNPVSSMTRQEVSKLFLKKILKWNNYQTVLPVDLTEDNPARKAFSKEIHKKDIKKVKAYWQKMIFSGRAIPPPQKAKENEVLAYVQSNPSAIGYVSASAQTGNVKVLKITEK